jgi:hypothetical protein
MAGFDAAQVLEPRYLMAGFASLVVAFENRE